MKAITAIRSYAIEPPSRRVRTSRTSTHRDGQGESTGHIKVGRLYYFPSKVPFHRVARSESESKPAARPLEHAGIELTSFSKTNVRNQLLDGFFLSCS
jgi:hypothetical protein